MIPVDPLWDGVSWSSVAPDLDLEDRQRRKLGHFGVVLPREYGALLDSCVLYN